MKNYRLLSDAILDGAKLSAQAFNAFYNNMGHTCALGAAILAITCEASADILALRPFDNVLDTKETCPIENCLYRGEEPGNVEAVIQHLNDYHTWSRERIAGFVATIEDRLGLVEIISDEPTIDVKEQSIEPCMA